MRHPRPPCCLQTGKLQGASLGPTLRSIYSTEGLPGLFRGNGASVLRIVPYAAVHFWCYEHYRRLLVAAEVLGAQVRLGSRVAMVLHAVNGGLLLHAAHGLRLLAEGSGKT